LQSALIAVNTLLSSEREKDIVMDVQLKQNSRRYGSKIPQAQGKRRGIDINEG